MNDDIEAFILRQTSASSVSRGKKIQSLWSGYGEIVKLDLQGADYPGIILKHVQLPSQHNHPRGWNTNRSHERKVKSYQIEMHWYQTYSAQTLQQCRIPLFLGSMVMNEQCVLLLEDLDLAGYSLRKSRLTLLEVKACLKWLAHFHGRFLGIKPEGLWEVGTYWHLATRPDEWEKMAHLELKNKASMIDEQLNSAQFKTLVHGDAKVANFCFSKGGQVAMVDFQYVGGGCGMKDVAYFLGSCLDEDACEAYELELLDEYFKTLRLALEVYQPSLKFEPLESEWRELFPVAWTDFYRFLNGWMPTHSKINAYTRRLSQEVLSRFS